MPEVIEFDSNFSIIKQLIDKLAVLCSEIIDSQSKLGVDLGTGISMFETESSRATHTTKFYNLTNYPLWVTDRHGAIIYLPVNPLLVKTEYYYRAEKCKSLPLAGRVSDVPTELRVVRHLSTYGDSAFRNISKAYSANERYTVDKLELPLYGCAFANAHSAKHRAYYESIDEAKIVFGIKQELLLQNKATYIHDLDVLVTLEDPSINRLMHPATKVGELLAQADTYRQSSNLQASGIVMQLNDPNDKIPHPKLYIKIGTDIIVTITKTADVNKPEGFYVYSTNMGRGESNVAQYFSIDKFELSEWGINSYPSYAEAVNSKGFDDTAKRLAEYTKIQQIRYENDKLIQANKELSVRAKDLESRVPLEVSKIKLEYEQLLYKERARTEELLREKEISEEKRKTKFWETVGNVAKGLAAVIGAIASVVGIIYATKPKPEKPK